MTEHSFSGAWYLHNTFARRMHDIIVPRIRAGHDPLPANFRQNIDKPLLTIEQMQGQAIKADEFRDEDGSWNWDRVDLASYRKAGGGQVALVPISGTMSREGFCGYGNEYLSRILSLADRDPKTKAVVLKANTPGGTVDSTKMLADTVKGFSKPILCWTPFCASAGYFVASQCDEIWMEDQTVSEVGSIGVLMVYVDQSEALRKEGYDVRIFRATGSEQKAQANGIEKLTPDIEARIQSQLDECRTEFVGYVRRGRAGKINSDEVFTGAMFGTKQALKLGLTDRIGSLDACLKQALKLS